MRYLMVDRVLALESGRSIRAVKCVARSEDAFRDHFSRRGLWPATLLLEAMLQALGWCVIEAHGFARSVVLSRLEEVQVACDLPPGVAVHLEGELHGTQPRGSFGTCRAVVEDREVARAGRILFAHVPNPDPESLRRRFLELRGSA